MTDYTKGEPVNFGPAIMSLEENLAEFKQSRETEEEIEVPPWPFVMSAGKTRYTCRKCGYDYEGGGCNRHEH